MNETTTLSVHDLPVEAAAFVDAARACPPGQLTACAGWTAHDLVAHVVAGGVEMARLIGERLAGEAVSDTVGFAEREAPARALDYGTLLDLLQGDGLLDAIGQVAPGATVPFTGWDMTPSALSLHIRSELAVHRWDLVGSDALGVELLSAPELTEHAVRSLTSFDVIDERVAARSRRANAGPVLARLRAEGQNDVVVDLRPGAGPVLRLEARTDEPAIETDAAARLLLLWGRRPSIEQHRIVADGVVPGDVRSVLAWLWS